VLVWVLPGDTGLARAMSWRPLRYTGRISYGLYLWHFPIFVLLRPRLEDLPAVMEIAVATAISYAVASLSFFAVERPFLQLKRRFAPRRADRIIVQGGREATGVVIHETPARAGV
jgi:peptidoglycan/LPS O-acetylase OafA/YrhL